MSKIVKRWGRYLAFIFLILAWITVLRFVRWRMVFAVFGKKAHQRANWPWWLTPFLPHAIPIGFMRGRFGWGVVIASKIADEDFSRKPELVVTFLSAITKWVRGNPPVALAGRLATWVGKSSLKEVRAPFVDGGLGTRFAMQKSILAAAAQEEAETEKRPEQLTLVILGGAGRIGSKLVLDMAEQFSRVIAVDPKYTEDQIVGNVRYTARPEAVSEADITLVMTAHGGQVQEYISYFPPGSIVADDTHPEIPKDLRRQIKARGVILLKAVMEDGQFAFTPWRLTGFGKHSIPGCVIEAHVINRHGWDVVANEAIFFNRVHEMGFTAHLITHPQDI